MTRPAPWKVQEARATSRLIGLRGVPRVDLRWPSPDALDPEQLATLCDLVARLATAGAALGEVPGHPWGAVRRADWTPAWEQDVLPWFNYLLSALRTAYREFEERENVPGPFGIADIERLCPNVSRDMIRVVMNRWR